MNKRISLGAALAVMMMVAMFTFTLTWTTAKDHFNKRVNDFKEREQEFEKFAEIDRLVRQRYYGSINTNQLMDSVAKGYLEGTGDKYAMYISAEEYKKLTQKDDENVGIGAVIEIAPDDFYLLVTEVYPDSPAQVAGIMPGDLIVAVNDTALTRENSAAMLESISGPQGTRIMLLLRRGSEELPNVEITRRAVSIPTVEAKMLEPGAEDEPPVGYIRIKEFGDRTFDQFNRELQKLLDNGAKALVFDLRDNKGGVLSSATRILDKLLPSGVLYTATYKDGTTKVTTSDANEVALPMSIIVNGGTASAAELFAQSIRDFDKGRIVGTTTVGKGVLQELLVLSDRSAIEITVAHYEPHSGISYNEIGVKPDFEVKLEGDYTQMEESMDAQLAKAREVALGMVRISTIDATGEEASGEEYTQPSNAE